MKNIFLLIATVPLFFSACNKSKNDPPDASSTIYIAGGFMSNGELTPCYWENGELHLITDDGASGRAYGINVLGNDIITCGEIKTDTTFIAFFSRNGLLDTLNRSGVAYDLDVLNGDVYVTGKYFMDDNIKEKACYWKNSQQIALPQNDIWGATNSIFIANNDIYISGYEIILSQSSGYAQYWKNGQLHHFPTKYSGITDVFVSSGDVYLPGATFDSVKHVFIPGYFKNDEWNAFSEGNIKCRPAGIFVSGTDVYIAGQKGDESGYWKNGVWNMLAINASVNAVAVKGSDVYICGTLANDEAGYWKNGVWNSLGKGVAQKILIR